jgi:hypothetical protein
MTRTNDNMNAASILGLIRHLLTFGGGYAVANGIADEATIEQLVGGIVTVLGIIWSIKQKANP